jgi:hypothetical protein
MNEGEGNTQADEQYRAGAREFVEAGRVPAAAAEARAAVDGPEAGELRVAERLAKGKGVLEEHDVEPLPSFWTPAHQSAWDMIKDAVKLALGAAPKADLDWDLARQAVRLGYGAAAFWKDDVEWSEALEGRVRAEWFGLGNSVPWDQALPLVRHGWELGRKDMTP